MLSNSAELGPNIGPRPGPNRPTSTEGCQLFPEFGQTWPAVGRTCPEFDQHRPHFARTCPTWPGICRIRAKAAQLTSAHRPCSRQPVSTFTIDAGLDDRGASGAGFCAAARAFAALRRRAVVRSSACAADGAIRAEPAVGRACPGLPQPPPRACARGNCLAQAGTGCALAMAWAARMELEGGVCHQCRHAIPNITQHKNGVGAV